MTWLVSPTKSLVARNTFAPRREKTFPTSRCAGCEKALQRVKFRENAGEAVVPGGTGAKARKFARRPLSRTTGGLVWTSPKVQSSISSGRRKRRRRRPQGAYESRDG